MSISDDVSSAVCASLFNFLRDPFGSRMRFYRGVTNYSLLCEGLKDYLRSPDGESIPRN